MFPAIAILDETVTTFETATHTNCITVALPEGHSIATSMLQQFRDHNISVCCFDLRAGEAFFGIKDHVLYKVTTLLRQMGLHFEVVPKCAVLSVYSHPEQSAMLAAQIAQELFNRQIPAVQLQSSVGQIDIILVQAYILPTAAVLETKFGFPRIDGIYQQKQTSRVTA